MRPNTLDPGSVEQFWEREVLASISTAVAEILGGAIALQMLFKLPIVVGAILTAGLVIWFLFSNSYPKIEKVIIGFVSLIGIALLLEILLFHILIGDKQQKEWLFLLLMQNQCQSSFQP